MRTTRSNRQESLDASQDIDLASEADTDPNMTNDQPMETALVERLRSENISESIIQALHSTLGVIREENLSFVKVEDLIGIGIKPVPARIMVAGWTIQDKTPTSSSSHQVKLPSHLPVFKTAKRTHPNYFLDELGTSLRAANIPVTRWTPILVNQIEGLHRDWAKTQLVDKSFEEASKLFVDRVRDTTVERKALDRLRNLSSITFDSMEAFLKLYLKLANVAAVDKTQIQEFRAFRDTLSLLDRGTLAGKLQDGQDEFHSLEDVIDFVRRAAPPDSQRQRELNMLKPREPHGNPNGNKRKRGDKNDTGEQQHKKKKLDGIQCFKCKKYGHYADKCPNKKQGKDQSKKKTRFESSRGKDEAESSESEGEDTTFYTQITNDEEAMNAMAKNTEEHSN